MEKLPEALLLHIVGCSVIFTGAAHRGAARFSVFPHWCRASGVVLWAPFHATSARSVATVELKAAWSFLMEGGDLIFHSWDLGNQGAVTLARAVLKSTNLSNLDLHNNSIGAEHEGAIALTAAMH